MFWVAALAALFFMPATGEGVSLCPSALLGFGRCPGCGLGHAIHDVLHLQLTNSFRHHLMGIPAVIIIFIRVKQLLLNPTTDATEPR